MKPYYDDGRGIVIYLGDCLEIVPQLEVVDIVLTDPPYGINTKSDGMGKLSPWADMCNSAYWYQAWLNCTRSRMSHTGGALDVSQLAFVRHIPEGIV